MFFFQKVQIEIRKIEMLQLPLEQLQPFPGLIGDDCLVKIINVTDRYNRVNDCYARVCSPVEERE